jgi:hypothetical protein
MIGPNEVPARLELGTIYFRAKCAAEDGRCPNLARTAATTTTDNGGRPIDHRVLCHRHAREEPAKARKADLKILDTRE